MEKGGGLGSIAKELGSKMGELDLKDKALSAVKNSGSKLSDMGKKAAQPFSLHYVKGHTPYGPITAGPEGVTYFTLRARWDTGAKYLPESRDLLKKSPKKHKMVAGIDVPELEDLLKFKACCQSAVMQVDAEGIGAYLYNIPPKVRAQLKMPSPGGGTVQYRPKGQYFVKWSRTSRTLRCLSKFRRRRA